MRYEVTHRMHMHFRDKLLSAYLADQTSCIAWLELFQLVPFFSLVAFCSRIITELVLRFDECLFGYALTYGTNSIFRVHPI